MTENIIYRGHKLTVMPHASGWKVFIYQPGSALAENTIPHSRAPGDREACIAEAKQIVDKLLKK